MFRRRVLLRKRKTVPTQCSTCGFGMAKKVPRRRKVDRVKKFFCKISGREYKAGWCT